MTQVLAWNRKRWFAKSFLLPSALNERYKKARMDFAQEFKSRRTSFWRSIYLLISVMDLGKHTRSHLWRELARKVISLIQKVSRPSKFLIWNGIKHENPCRWTSIEHPMNNAKFISVVADMLPEFSERMYTGKVIIFQDSDPGHVSLEVSKNINSNVFDSKVFPLRLVKDSKDPKFNLFSCPQ